MAGCGLLVHRLHPARAATSPPAPAPPLSTPPGGSTSAGSYSLSPDAEQACCDLCYGQQA